MEQLAGAAWKLARISRGEDVLVQWAVHRYLETEPPHGWSTLPKHGPWRRMRDLRTERQGCDCALDSSSYLLDLLRRSVKEHGSEQTRQWCLELPAEMAADEKLAELLRAVVPKTKPDTWLQEVERKVSTHVRGTRRKRKQLDGQIEALIADLTDVFFADLGRELDPKAPDLDRVARRRRGVVREADKLLDVLAKVRALSLSAQGGLQTARSQLRAITGELE